MSQNKRKSNKIAYVITKSNWGGAQRYVYDLATHVPPSEFEVVAIFGGQGLLKTRLETAGIRCVSVSGLERDVNLREELAVFWRLWRIFRLEKPSVVHLNSSKIGGLGALAARCAGVPRIIFTAHGWAFNEERARFTGLAIRFLSWLTVLFCHEVIVLGRNEAKQACRMPFAKKKIRMIPNGILPSEFLEANAAKRVLFDKVGIGDWEDGIVVGAIAELHKNKGLEFAVMAMREIIAENREKTALQTILLILGEGDERENLCKLIVSYNLEDRVFLIGYVENAASYLKAFDVLILPSIKEGLPYTLLEAGLAERAVIASRVGLVQDLIENGKTGCLVEPKDVIGLTRAMNELMYNPKLRSGFGGALKHRIEAAFPFEKMLVSTLAVYAQGAVGKAGPINQARISDNS